MAEIFATVASGAGLASLGLQLVECVVKLKAFYETVEKAPKSLNRISREINTFALLLRQIDDTRSRHGIEDSELLEESIEICVECTQEIVQFTSQLEAIMRRYHAAGRIYSALRMRDVQEICANLERAKNSLMVAFQVFDHRTQVRMMDATQQLAVQQSLILMKHSEALSQVREDTAMLVRHSSQRHIGRVLDLSDTDADGLDGSDSFPSRTEALSNFPVTSAKRVGRVHRRRRYCRLRLPSWFSNSVWQVTVSRSLGRWELCLQTYNQRPEYSDIVQHYLAGRVGVVRKMLENGTASLNDVYGTRTPLELAVMSGSVEMLQFLQKHELFEAREVLCRALEIWLYAWPSTGYIEQSTESNKTNTQASEQLLRIAECLITDGRIDVEDFYGVDSLGDHFAFGACPSAILPLINQQMARPLETWTNEQRFSFLWTKMRAVDVTPDLFTTAFPTMDGMPSVSRILPDFGGSPLHYVAREIAERLRSSRFPIGDLLSYSANSPDRNLNGWRRLLKMMIQAGCDLYSPDEDGRTPLQAFIHYKYMLSTYDLQYWAACIGDAGVDLDEYGRMELTLWRNQTSNEDASNSRCSYLIDITATGFDFGSTADDWHLLLEHKLCIPVWEFEFLPGSWPKSIHYPRTICWAPLQTTEIEEGGSWAFKREIYIEWDPFIEPVRIETTELEHLLGGSQDDNLALARFLSDHRRPRTARRRRQSSQPPPWRHLHFDIRLQSYVKADNPPRTLLWGNLHYCPHCSKRVVTSDFPSHRRDHLEDTCSERPMWEPELHLQRLRLWKQFVDKFGRLPVHCDVYKFPKPGLIYPVSYTLVDIPEIFSMSHQYWSEVLFCDGFPDCLHQRSYLDLISNTIEQNE